MGWIDRAVRAFEVAIFGDYTGSPEAAEAFIRRRLIGMGYSVTVVDRVLREDRERRD